MPNLHLYGFRLRLLGLVSPCIAGQTWRYSTPVPHHLPAGLPWACFTLGISFLCPEMLAGWKVWNSDFHLTFQMPGSPFRAVWAQVRELTFPQG